MVCLCVTPGLWCLPFAQASGCISMYLCISTAVYDVFLPQWNHPVLMFFSGINHSLGNCLQWYVAIQDPAVMQMNRILGTGWGSWSGRAGLAAGSHWISSEESQLLVGLPGTSAGMRRRWWRREGV